LNESREREIFKVRDSVRLRVQSVEELSKVIIPHYLKYPLITNKQALAADRSSDVSPPPSPPGGAGPFFHISFIIYENRGRYTTRLPEEINRRGAKEGTRCAGGGN